MKLNSVGCAWILLALIASAQVTPAFADQAREFSDQTSVPAGVEVFFTPEDDATKELVSLINKAKRDIRVQAYLFTSYKLSNALVRAYQRGVKLEVIVDREQLEKGGSPRATEIAVVGGAVYVDSTHAAAHNKVILIDSDSEAAVVVTGSYNFTVAAQSKNAENLVIMRGNRQVASQYLKNWHHHRAHSIRMQ